jgi:hypothetical protein
MSDNTSSSEPPLRVMRAAARVYVAADKKLGLETAEWIKELAKPNETEVAIAAASRRRPSWWRRLISSRH